MGDSIGADQSHCLHIAEEDGFGCGEGEEILLDENQLAIDGYLVVLVENLSHF